jgi:5'-3' exonuclease/transcription antitermination factor NusG
MTDKWIVLELASRSEGEDPDLIRQVVRATVKDAEVFVPAVVTQIGDDRVVHYLVEGYAFVRYEHTDSAYLRLENTRYIQSVLTEPGAGKQRQLATITTSEVEKMRRQVEAEVDQGIGVGDTVLVTSGPYRNIEATVIEEIPEQGRVQVYVCLRSKESLITLPRSFLRVVDRAPLSPALSKLNALKVWTQKAAPILSWDSPVEPLLKAYDKYHELYTWCDQGLTWWPIVALFNGSLDHKSLTLQKTWVRVSETTRLMGRAGPLWEETMSLSRFLSDAVSPEEIEDKLSELTWFEAVLAKIRSLGESLDRLEYQVVRYSGKKNMIQNILIDGYNLAYRCWLAPGLNELRDSHGRFTGMVVGFLNSLGALKKRYPEAVFYVAWDRDRGGSKRRSIYGEYKANRTHREGTDEQLDLLYRVLPLLGVRQAESPGNEADDVLASLVHNELQGQQNLIFSNDRDFLQLVSKNTSLLVPKAGSRKEILYDPDGVRKDWGVFPEDICQLRAFFGDTSDNLPGVPRVPKKILRDLVKAHGSVDGVYNSGLAGLTRNQYERLRLAEPQVRLNLRLMTLEDVTVSIKGPDVSPEGVVSLLKQIEVSPKSVLTTFFRHSEAQ